MVWELLIPSRTLIYIHGYHWQTPIVSARPRIINFLLSHRRAYADIRGMFPAQPAFQQVIPGGRHFRFDRDSLFLDGTSS
jgi:hypothetical protein